MSEGEEVKEGDDKLGGSRRMGDRYKMRLGFMQCVDD